MKNSTKLLVFLTLGSLLYTGCGKNKFPETDNEESEEHGGESSNNKNYTFSCNISWDGFTPSATFADTSDPSKTSEDISALFEQKHSRKVLSYPSSEQKGLKEHTVKYVLKADSSLSFSSSTTNEEFELEHVDINEEKVLNYLRATTLEETYQALVATKNESHDTSHYTLSIPTYGGEQTSLYLASDSNFETNVTKYLTETDSYTFDYLIPGQTYYWKAVSKTSGVEFDGGVFTVNEDNVRFGNFDRVGNMRDLGGWKTSENSQIKFNMIFRGRNPDSLDAKQKNAITEAFGFKTQIDLRADADGPINVRICPNVNYYYFNMSKIYNQIVDTELNEMANVCETPDEDNGKRLTYREIIGKFFTILSKPESYPVYFHCIHGADRTGTFAFLLEALLGLSLDDLYKEYELTSFNSKSGQRLRGKANAEGTSFALPLEDSNSGYGIQHLITVLNSETGDTLQCKVEHFLINKIGLTTETITSIRNLLIEQL